MAKGNMFLGMSRGSVGDVTFYRGRGQQIARARNRNPKNPRSTAQVIQRMVLATASKAYARLKSIADHSFQGVSYGADSQSYFLKRAMDDIRAWVAQTINITTEYPDALRDPLLYRGLAKPNDAFEAGVGLLISEGTIPSVPAVLATPEGGEPMLDHWGALVGAEASIVDVLSSLGAVAGDQITAVGLSATRGLVASRYVINSDATPAQLEEQWDGSIDSAAFDSVKSSLSDSVILDNVGGKLRVVSPVGSGILSFEASAVIISRKVGDTWQRSTQRLVWVLDAGDYAYTDYIASLWMAGTTPIDTESPYYLNNADE